MNAQHLPPVAKLVPDISQEERGFQAVGRSAEEIRHAGARLLSAFEHYQAAVDELTEMRIGSAALMMDKPVEVAFAAWRNETRPSVDSADTKLVDGWSLRVDA